MIEGQVQTYALRNRGAFLLRNGRRAAVDKSSPSSIASIFYRDHIAAGNRSTLHLRKQQCFSHIEYA